MGQQSLEVDVKNRKGVEMVMEDNLVLVENFVLKNLRLRMKEILKYRDTMRHRSLLDHIQSFRHE